MSLNFISKDDENFLKDFLKDFYRKVINMKDYSKFEPVLTEWVQDFFKYNKKNSKVILELMKNHEKNENWFSSLIGLFYEYGIGDTSIINKNKSLELYLLSINEENKKLISVYQILNIIIAKYMLSLYYYKDIILDKRELMAKEFRRLLNLKHAYVIPQNHFEYFNGLEINIHEDEINTIENYFELLNNNLIGSNEKIKNQTDYFKKKESVEQNYLGFCYQYGIGKKKNEFKAFEFYLKSAERGNLNSQNKLGIFYHRGNREIGIEKDEKKAFELYSKTANEGDLGAQINLGFCYQYGIGIEKDEMKAFELYLKAANRGDAFAQYRLGDCYQNGIGIEKNEKKAFEWYFKSAGKGFLNAQNQLGVCYRYGIGIEKDEKKAIKWYLKAADDKNLFA